MSRPPRHPAPEPALRPLLWLRTARHLPPAQAAAWLRYRLRPPGPVALAPGEHAGVPSSAWQALAARARGLEPDPSAEAVERASRLTEGRYEFVGRERRLAEIDWRETYESRLWTYHLHYFDHAVDLVRAWGATGESRYAERAVYEWSSWIEAARHGAARLEPYPTSVRVLNGLRTLWLAGERLPGPFAASLRSVVHAQLDWLASHLETHLGGNHLQRNLTALAWGHLSFSGPDAERWGRSLRQLWSLLHEQVLPDGGHFERSPMYHAAALDDFLRTAALSSAADADPGPLVRVRLAAMTRVLRHLVRPDGTLHLFNDSANGQPPLAADVLWRAGQVLDSHGGEPEGTFALPDTGYYGFVDATRGLRLVIDAGPLGPSHQPGHAHSDMLSFVLDVRNRPVVVDSGLHGYDGDPFREYVRSVRAHNTVGIGELDQHEMWSTFRVARRGEILEASPPPPAGSLPYRFTGACRPYHVRGAVHRRTIELQRAGLVVSDEVEGARGRPVSSWLHLHPDFDVEADRDAFRAVAAGARPARLRIEPFGADAASVRRGEMGPVQGWYCPEFGRAESAGVLELRLAANDGRRFGYRVSWD